MEGTCAGVLFNFILEPKDITYIFVGGIVSKLNVTIIRIILISILLFVVALVLKFYGGQATGLSGSIRNSISFSNTHIHLTRG